MPLQNPSSFSQHAFLVVVLCFTHSTLHQAEKACQIDNPDKPTVPSRGYIIV